MVPIVWNDPTIIQRMAKLFYRHQGVLRVDVLMAQDLVAADFNGKSDPFVQVVTDGRCLPSSPHI